MTASTRYAGSTKGSPPASSNLAPSRRRITPAPSVSTDSLALPDTTLRVQTDPMKRTTRADSTATVANATVSSIQHSGTTHWPAASSVSARPLALADTTMSRSQTAPVRRTTRPYSTTTTASTAISSVRCSGTTRQKIRCSLPVKKLAENSRGCPDATGELRYYCHHHRIHKLAHVAFSAPNQKIVKYAGESVCAFLLIPELTSILDWVPAYLQEETQLLLRQEMSRPLSESDEPGYIYAFEIGGRVLFHMCALSIVHHIKILDCDDPHTMHLKVGRTVQITKRLDKWAKQCSSRPHIFRGFWPPTEASGGSSTLDLGRLHIGLPGPWCHRLERLIHIELADLAVYAPYLEPDFKNLTGGFGDAGLRLLSKGSCDDCK